jgi:hypothetical protein
MRNRFHSLCPYFAMFPETFVEHWVGKLTKEGDLVLDPFCGRGTTPFQALLMGRRAIANDINPVAYCVTRAKTNAPALAQVRARLSYLRNRFDTSKFDAAAEDLPEFFRHAYHARTLRQLLYLRSQLRWRSSDLDCMVAALTLGALHGEIDKSPSYLSNQMRRTISTKPAYSVAWWASKGLIAPPRDAFVTLDRAATFRYASERPALRATVFNRDMRSLSVVETLPTGIRCAVTSPPYLDVTDFEEDQWLRLWFLGGPPHPTTGKVSRDDRHTQSSAYWQMIADMWRSLGSVLDEKAHVVVRIGAKGVSTDHLIEKLGASAVVTNRKVKLVSHEVSEIRRRQTDSFRPGSTGCLVEVDCHFKVA